MTTIIDAGPTTVLPTSPLAELPERRRWIVSASQRLVLSHPSLEQPSSILLSLLGETPLETAVSARSGRAPLPDLDGVELAFVVGSEPLQEAADSGWLEHELDWLRAADDAGARLVGIGHGARVLALAFGGSVTPAALPYRGWMLVDSAVPHLIPHGPWIAWQHDLIGLPPGAKLLAANRLGPQAFRIGRHLGIQFHPDATPLTMHGWETHSGADPATAAFVARAAHDPSAARARAKRLLRTLLEG